MQQRPVQTVVIRNNVAPDRGNYAAPNTARLYVNPMNLVCYLLKRYAIEYFIAQMYSIVP